MAHFAQLDENNVVIYVTHIDNEIITDENGVEQEYMGIQHIHNTIPESQNYTWKQTSYGNNFRFRYAAIGYVYNEELDAFISPFKPYDSWVLDNSIADWAAPIPKPDQSSLEENQRYLWNEENLQWEVAYVPNIEKSI